MSVQAALWLYCALKSVLMHSSEEGNVAYTKWRWCVSHLSIQQCGSASSKISLRRIIKPLRVPCTTVSSLRYDFPSSAIFGRHTFHVAGLSSAHSIGHVGMRLSHPHLLQ